MIQRYFATLADAEAFQDKLYNKYDSVQLVRSPQFSEAGQYAWVVK